MLNIYYFIVFVKCLLCYPILGKFEVIEAVGKYGGHTAVALVHPTGISIHTLENFEPDGRTKLIPFGNPGSAIDNDGVNSTHSILPPGQSLLSAPFVPIGPCAPVDPDTNSFGFAIAAASHANCVTDNPAAPAGGLLPEVIANEEVNVVIVIADGTLDVTAAKEKLTLRTDIASEPPKGK